MNWYDSNPYGSNPTFMQSARWKAHQFGRQQYTSNFASGGISSTLFAGTPTDAFKSVFRKSTGKGSPEQIRRLQNLAIRYPDNPNINKALKNANANKMVPKSTLSKFGGATLGHLATGAFIGATMFTTPGGLVEKTRATASEAVGFAGWTPGMAAGAAVGSSILPVIGTGIGMLVGGLAGQIGLSAASDYAFKTTDRMVESQKRKRNINWVGDSAAFNTQGAHTMRQQSLQAMNRGMSTARSALGREAVMVHQ